MDWPKFLLIAISAISISTFQPIQSASASSNCSLLSVQMGTCSGAQVKNNSVDVWTRSTTPGGSSDSVATAGDVSRASSARSTTKPLRYATGTIAFNCFARLATRAACVTTPSTAPVVTPVYYAPITLEDLASFVPQQASLVSQPRGWTVVNLDTNFIAGASQHVVGGSLFGRSAEVRFTPHGYDWNYGDGGAQSTATGGARWDVLGLREFSPTATSHIYRSLGSFTTSVVVRYGVEYRIGGGSWVSVDGEVSSAATTQVVLVQSADTVLAARDCSTARSTTSCPS